MLSLSFTWLLGKSQKCSLFYLIIREVSEVVSPFEYFTWLLRRSQKWSVSVTWLLERSQKWSLFYLVVREVSKVVYLFYVVIRKVSEASCVVCVFMLLDCCAGPTGTAGKPADKQSGLLPAAGGDVQPTVTGGSQLTTVPHQQEGLLRQSRNWQRDDTENNQVSQSCFKMCWLGLGKLCSFHLIKGRIGVSSWVTVSKLCLDCIGHT